MQVNNIGLLADRPTFETQTGDLYYATDTELLYFATTIGESVVWVPIGASAAKQLSLRLSAADVLALNSTPLEIVPAAPAGFFHVILGMCVSYIFGTTAYTITNPADVIALADAFGLNYAAVSMTGFIDQALSLVSAPAANVRAQNDPTLTGALLTAGAADGGNVVVRASNNPTLGDGTLVVTAIYATVPIV